MQLITSGNPNIKTIRNVVYFANKYYNNEIQKVFFIDNPSSLYRDGISIEGERNEIVRSYIDDVSIESKLVDTTNFHEEIPRLLSEKLSIYSNNEIIVDLTNGNKFISSVLYAAASLSQINNLFFLFIPQNKLDINPEELKDEDYRIDVMSPLNNLENIGKYTYFEIIFYQEKINTIVQSFSEIAFKSDFINSMFEKQLRDAISSYFLEKYPASISNIGQLIEAMTMELCKSIKDTSKGEIKAKNPKNFNAAIDWLRINFCDPLRTKRNQGLFPYEEKLKDLQNIDKIIDIIRVYRNLSSHPYENLRGKEEASLALKNSIYLLDLVNKTKIFL